MNFFLSMEILWIFLGSSQNWTFFLFLGGGGGAFLCIVESFY